jgi:hypothetical protein
LFVLGHVGIGTRLLDRLRLPAGPLFFGCLLPDIIDKPLFYLVGPGTWPLVMGTRTFAHTGIFFLLLLGAALATRSAALRAVALGVGTHLLLDLGSDLVSFPPIEDATSLSVFFPLLGVRFPVAPFKTLREHLLLNATSSYVLAGEVIGLVLLIQRSRAKRRET